MLGKREREEEAGEEMDNSGWRTAGGSTRSSKPLDTTEVGSILLSYLPHRNNLRTGMLKVQLKRSLVFLTIYFVFMLPLIIFASHVLKLPGSSDLAALTGVSTLLIGVVGFILFHWCLQICSKRSMTVPVSVTASSSNDIADDPSPPHTNYEVFISFRGEDTRDNFTSHLYDALCRKKVKTFIDNRLNRGDEISSTLLKTIEESEIYVIIFSNDYASSTWCLDELAKILECKERYGRLVIPIFYNVNPSNVRRQAGSYADSFVKHKKRFDRNKLLKWKSALTQASNLSGLDSTKIRPEPKLIKKIVQDIFKKLKRNSSYDLEALVGIHDHILEIESLLNIGSQEVQIVGVYGMGGIGKTTIADAIFHKLQAQFESSSFVLSVQEQLRTTGLDHVRDKYLQELLEEEDIGIRSFRSLFVKKLLQQKKILLVLDDISKLTQIEDLIGGRDWFGPGSRIIITTRDMQVLRSAKADKIYHVKEMRFNDALQLFSIKAFNQDIPIKEYVKFSEQAVNYCGGNPLALKVLGSYLCGRTEQEWESALKKLQNTPHKEIFYVLKLSFDGLDDDEKEMFLDITVFYDGMHIDDVKESFASCGFFADIGISVLINRSLISLWSGEIVMTHNLIKAMGKEIACQANVYKSGIRRRLLKHEDIYQVFKKNEGMEDIHGISLDLSKIKKIYLRPDAFEGMDNLKILKFYNHPRHASRLYISDGLTNLPEELRIFHWDEYPHRFVPLHSCASNIVKLQMRNSKVKQLWDENQHLPNLKQIDLNGSKNLIEIPDLSTAPNIREIHFYNCKSLSQVYSSSSLSKLRCLWLGHSSDVKTVNVGGSKVGQRSWRLLAVNEFFKFNYSNFIKLKLEVFKSDSRSNTYNFRVNLVSVPSMTGISRSKSIDTNTNSGSAMHATIKSVLPNLEMLRLLDNPSSLGSLSKLFYLRLKFGPDYPNIDFMMLSTFPELMEATESLCSPSMKRTEIEVVSLRDDLIGLDDSLSQHTFYNCRLSKIPRNNFRLSCLTQVSLYRSDIVTVPASIHCPSRLNSLLSQDYTRTQFTAEFTFSLDSEIPRNASEITLSIAEQLNPRYQIFIRFTDDVWEKTFLCGDCFDMVPESLFLTVYLL